LIEVIVSDEPEKLADEQPEGTLGLDAQATPAPASENGQPANSAPAEAAPADVPSSEEGADDFEIVPISSAPLSRPATAASEAEQAAAAKKAAEAAGDIRFDWYILKVQSNREKSIAEALKRKIAVEGLERYFDKGPDGKPLVMVPTEKVTEFKAGKKKIVERKLYPGYIVVRMHITDETWFAVRETSGIGDFTGAGGKPSPMLPHETARLMQSEEEESAEAPKLDIKFKVGDRVKVKDGTFEGFEGEVSAIDLQSGKITVMINIFGRSTPVELEYWQVEGV
jgi:transcriptional antiterminator NusG